MKSFQSSGDGEDKGEVSGDTGFLRKSGRCSQKDRSTGKTRKVDPTRRVTVKKEKEKCRKFRQTFAGNIEDNKIFGAVQIKVRSTRSTIIPGKETGAWSSNSCL